MEHARHVFRAGLVLLVVVVAVSITRTFLVPKSYGDYGSYRYDNVAEQRVARVPRHGGVESCAACHAKQAKERAAGSHKTVSCEVCHGPLALHASAGTVTGPMPVDRGSALCARCHRRVAGRPEKFPQVVLHEHNAEMHETGGCIACHQPHSPKP
jgi:hypothetical protein